MALADPTGGAGRSTLIDALDKLRRQYAGDPRSAIGSVNVPADATGAIANRPPVDPLDFLPGAPPFINGVTPSGPMAPPTRTSTGPYDLAGDGGAWGPNGVNLFNPNLARGDMAAPGPGWVMDNFGTPFWRHDYVAGPGGRPVIKGSSEAQGFSDRLLSPAELAAFGIQ